MSQLFYRARDCSSDLCTIVTPDNSDLEYVSLARRTFRSAGDVLEMSTEGNELAIDILGGKIDVRLDRNGKVTEHNAIGERDNPFAGKPTTVYVPRGSKIRIMAKTGGADIVLAWCPARRDTEPALITPDDVVTKVVGKDNWQRNVETAIGPNIDADRLLVGETFNPPGNWSSAPPHKHDVDNPGKEARLEEVYFYMTDKPDGFGIQRVYSGADSPTQGDDLYLIRGGDTVAMPYGYHPIVAGPGYRVMYVWVLAGAKREYGAWSIDPAHSWLLDT